MPAGEQTLPLPSRLKELHERLCLKSLASYVRDYYKERR